MTTLLPHPSLPISTEKKNCTMGMFRIGAERFKNQFGVMGKSLRNSRKKNRLFLFSCTCRESASPASGTAPALQQGLKLDSSFPTPLRQHSYLLPNPPQAWWLTPPRHSGIQGGSNRRTYMSWRTKNKNWAGDTA